MTNAGITGMTLDSKVKTLFESVLRVSSICIDDTIETVDVWDSMMHMELMVALEREWGLRLESDEIVSLISVRAIQEFLHAKGKL